ncbi:hypothetical protein [Enterobacter pseudoroggenkampii]|uniref:hypothetical protein n=1 Tax=Enterobacter pseudoroggenkampii TaxID=2996112 RepID=UPI002264EAED|nr:hypothetical protein [Enterobacter pseudoroggenkampii]MCX8289112.1 hypothetical protein [Enterobacter pseudoroggenkampii]
MQLTRDILSKHFVYDAENECFLYRENKNKRVEWNKRYSGQKVKPIISDGSKYISVNNALYPISGLIILWEEGTNERLKSKALNELIKKDSKRLAMIRKMSIEDLKSFQKDLLEGDYKKDKRKIRKGKEVIYDVNDMEPKRNGYPSHIYFNEVNQTYYVKFYHNNRKVFRYNFQTLEEALQVRNELYNEIGDT